MALKAELEEVQTENILLRLETTKYRSKAQKSQLLNEEEEAACWGR
jgi:regulator of replication initiation timing